ncbi:peptidoglycan-binding domain-containing protein [Treponema sp. R6D11]
MKTKQQCLEWFKKELGKKVDYDGVNGVQCVDGVKAFLAFVWDKKIPAMGNGKDVANNAKKMGLTAKTDTGVYVCSTDNSKYGHTFIIIDGYVYEENGNGKNGGYQKVKYNSSVTRFKKPTKYPIGNISGGATSSATPTTFPELKQGSSGASVKILQAALNVNGAKLTVDGVFGAKTKEAVISFQKSKKLVQDGVVGAKTWAALGK